MFAVYKRGRRFKDKNGSRLGFGPFLVWGEPKSSSRKYEMRLKKEAL
jgi:hypothetical protein